MNRWYWRIIAGLSAAGIIAAVVMLTLPKPPIPGAIKQQLTSTLMLPNTSRYPVARSSTKYDTGLKLLTFDVTAFHSKLIVSEQPTPDQFVDVPAVYQKVLDGMSDYADFDVSLGTVHLTTSPQLHGGQTAVLNAKGTLVFAKPATGLSEDQWHQFFTSFAVAQ